RWVVGTGIGLAVAVAFFPSVWIPLVAFVLMLVVVPERGGSRLRGVAMMSLVALASAALLFPFVLTLVRGGGDTAVAPGSDSFLNLLRLAPGPGPGTGPAAWFLPLAALVSFSLIEGGRQSWRALVTVLVGLPLAWLAAAGYLPAPFAVPSAFLALAGFAMAILIGMATGGLFVAARRAAFGTRQIAVALLGAILALGLAAQSLSILPGGWAVGESRILPAWPVVASSAPDLPLRVLWLREPDGEPFAPPGGDPQGVVSAGAASVAYGVTGRGGRSILALGAPASGRAFTSLERSLQAILSARVRHGGALLAPFAIGFLVVEPGTLPPEASDRLAEQVDLDLVQRAGGLLLYRNARALPHASALPASAVGPARTADLLSPTAIDAGAAVPLRGSGGSWTGEVPQGGLALVADEFDADWTSGGGAPFPAFGWALGFEAASGTRSLTFDGRLPWMLQLIGLAVLWAAAMWTVRRRPAEETGTRPRPIGGARPSVDRPATRVPAS
ncbi:MAG: hypothetical protein M3135_08110, partial [Actinomycetota bacterium]|nr:hypothetical protein [Actinomycetota bacterium]